MRFRHAHAAHPDWSVAVEECLLHLQAYAGDERYARNPNLGFVYLTDALAPQADEILTTLKVRTGIPNWVGSVGAGICATGVEYTDEPALAVMLGSFAPGSFNVFSGTQRPPALGLKTASGAPTAFTALVHADPNTPDLAELIVDMATKVESGYLFGGLSSARGRTLQIADRILGGGLSGVVFSGDVNLVSRVSQGCHPFSSRRTVTRADHNLILELDGERAFELLIEDAGIRERVLSGGPREARAALATLARRGLFVGIEPPAGHAYRERTPVTDYVVRHVVALDPNNGSVAIAGSIDDGAAVCFCTRDETAARKDLVRICSETICTSAPSRAHAAAPVPTVPRPKPRAQSMFLALAAARTCSASSTKSCVSSSINWATCLWSASMRTARSAARTSTGSPECLPYSIDASPGAGPTAATTHAAPIRASCSSARDGPHPDTASSPSGTRHRRSPEIRRSWRPRRVRPDVRAVYAKGFAFWRPRWSARRSSAVRWQSIPDRCP
jgi:small ligand-binding sensory domain FIST